MLLARMFYLVETGKISEPIYSSEQAQPGTSNKAFLVGFVGNLLQTAFPNLQAYVPLLLLLRRIFTDSSSIHIQQFIDGLFLYNNDLTKFKTNLRDFLIGLKEFSGDNAELFSEDRDLEKQAAVEAERERAKKVGGLLKPADLDQDDEL